MSTETLFKDTLAVVNVGLQGFADNVIAAGGQCVALQWQPPAQGDRDGGWALAELLNHPTVETANDVRAGAFHRSATGAHRRGDRARRAARHGGRSPPDRARRAADRLAGDVRADARRRAGRGGARGLGRFGGRGAAAGRSRRRRARTVPPPGRRRPDGRHHQPVDAAVRGREQGGGQSRVLQFQRGPGQGAALRRQRARRHRPLAHDGRRDRADAACRADGAAARSS